MSSRIEKLIDSEIDTINDHLPRTRHSLVDLINADAPGFLTKTGETSVMKMEEIKYLAKDVPEKFHSDVMLPIVLLRRLDLGRGIYTIAGSKIELFLVHRVIQQAVGQVDLEWDRLDSWEPVERLARPHVQVLRRKLSSTTCIGFAFLKDEESSFSNAEK